MSAGERAGDDDPGAALRSRLRRWYRAARRDLPWRRSRDPYAIWISEAMLQQTRVEVVRERWPEFLRRFPTIGALAAATADDVLAAWSGLGYYRRARRLHEAAYAVIEAGGEFPSTREGLLALPGVGPYTAGAVASIAFDRREALVDGNVARVFARLFALEETNGVALERAAWSIARELLPRSGVGEWNQALMEFGALVCTPRAPDCTTCPLHSSCRARQQGRVHELPRKAPRAAAIDVRLRLHLCLRGDAVLLEQRPPGGRMAGLWQLPTLECGTTSGLFPSAYPHGPSFDLPDAAPLGEFSHAITRHRIRASVVRARPRAGPIEPPFAWVEHERVATVAQSGLLRKVVARGWLGRPAVRRG